MACRRSPAPSYYLNQWSNIVNWTPLGANFSENIIVIHAFPFKKMHLKMLSGNWRLFCLGLNVLKKGLSPNKLWAPGRWGGNLNLVIFKHIVASDFLGIFQWQFYTPRTTKWFGWGWVGDILVSLCLSFCLSRIRCPLCSAYSSGWIHFLFTHHIKQLQKVCRM